MSNCIFCDIINGNFNTYFLYEDECFVAFKDINPQAPIHILIVPKKHTNSLSETEDSLILNNLLSIVRKICILQDIKDYRLIINNGEESGQEVKHLHLHILSGRKLHWPPG